MDSEKISERNADYAVEYFRDGKGRLKKKSVYRGPEFCYVLPEAVRRKGAVLLVILTALSVVFTMIPLLVISPLMHKWYTSMPFIVILFGDIHLIMGLVIFLKAREPLERRDTRNGFERIAIWSFLNMFFSFSSLVGQIGWHVKNGFKAADTCITVVTLLLFAASVLIFKAKGCAEARESGG